jgi:hypothetical protein
MTQLDRISVLAHRATSADFRFFLYIDPFQTSALDFITGNEIPALHNFALIGSSGLQ